MALRGDIKTFSLAAIGRMIHDEKKTGILKVSSGSSTTRIYYKEGGIVFLSGNVAEDLSLGSLLKANDLIDEERLQRSLKMAAAAGKRLGVVLIEQGYISQERLIRILHYQFKEAVTDMLTWQEGEFEYRDGLGDYIEDIRLAIDPIRLVAEAQKWKEFRHHIPSDQVVFQIKDSERKLESFESDGALRVMLMIDGRRTVQQIMTETGLSRLAVYKALTSLVTQGIVARKGTEGATEADGGPNPFETIELFLTVLDGVLSGMTAELGRPRALAFLTNSMQQHPAYAHGLNAFQADATVRTNLNQIESRARQQILRIGRDALASGFLAVVAAFLRQGYQVLGFRAIQNMVARIREGLQHVPVGQQPYFENEKVLVQQTDGSAVTPVKQTRTSAGAPALGLDHFDKISTTAVITFYHQALQMVARDLEREIGSQVANLFKGVMADSNYYDRLLASFDINATGADNVKFIHAHVASRGSKIDKQALVQAFENLLASVLQEEKRMLGPKATRASVLRLESNIGQIEQGKYKPLQDHLNGLLKHLKVQWGA
jgi:hypothetical protein